jgi:predicted lipoprotein with Yx(FWY)xxD motif
MATSRMSRRQHPHIRGNADVFAPGDYGRVTKPDGMQQWLVRGLNGNWIPITQQHVTEHEDGTITVSSSR